MRISHNSYAIALCEVQLNFNLKSLSLSVSTICSCVYFVYRPLEYIYKRSFSLRPSFHNLSLLLSHSLSLFVSAMALLALAHCLLLILCVCGRALSTWFALSLKCTLSICAIVVVVFFFFEEASRMRTNECHAFFG